MARTHKKETAGGEGGQQGRGKKEDSSCEEK